LGLIAPLLHLIQHKGLGIVLKALGATLVPKYMLIMYMLYTHVRSIKIFVENTKCITNA